MESKNNRSRSLETILVFIGVCVVLFWIYNKKIFLLVSLLLILLSLTSEAAVNKISSAWLKFSELLGKVMSRIILSVVYYVILVPIAFLFRLTGKDQLQLKKSKNSYYLERNHQYTKSDVENIW